MVEHKDVVSAILGAAAGLSGLVLVFLGIVVTRYQAFPSDTSANVLRPYRQAAALVLVAFAFGLLCVAASTGWLVNLGHHTILYRLTIGSFGAETLLLGASTTWVVYQSLWSD